MGEQHTHFFRFLWTWTVRRELFFFPLFFIWEMMGDRLQLSLNTPYRFHCCFLFFSPFLFFFLGLGNWHEWKGREIDIVFSSPFSFFSFFLSFFLSLGLDYETDKKIRYHFHSFVSVLNQFNDLLFFFLINIHKTLAAVAATATTMSSI